MLQKLPIDLSTFSELRRLNYLYVDKTKYAYDLITGGRRFFLSRPRRFGKTLFVSTLKEILLAKQGFFEGLWIASSDYHWQEHGVIHLDLSALGIESPESFKAGVNRALTKIANSYSLTIYATENNPVATLQDLVEALHKRFGHVALLIDEYDNPILHALKDPERAEKIRDTVRTFFTAIKGLDAEINFLFITGVSNFAKAGLFSGLNNLQIISLDDRFSTVCGYTQEEVNHYFKDHLTAWAEKEQLSYQELQQQIKEWYNGYRFSGNAQSVYNPFSLMRAIATETFENFWFQSGAPTFLIHELEKEYRKTEYSILGLKKLEISRDALGIFDIGATPLPALMFQTGYLTIIDYDRKNNLYTLDYPNAEVRIALQKHTLAAFSKLDFASADQIATQLKHALTEGSVKKFVHLLKQLFTNIPYQLHVKQEKFYHALLQMACDASSIKAQSEYSISHGRIDLVIDLPHLLYVIEIKFNQPAQVALAQVEEMGYHQPFLKIGKPILLLGLSFHREPESFEITYEEKRLPA